MGHISHEPSMEEILSSIKRIIAEDGEAPASGRGRRAGERRAMPRHDEDEARIEPADEPEILELTDEFTDAPAEQAEPEPEFEPEPVEPEQAAAAQPEPQPQPEPEPAPPEADEMIDEDLVSTTAAKQSRQALASLSKMLVKPEPPSAGDNTLEGLVRDMLRPMLKDWLDANLPDLVEKMVAKEIAKISGKGL